MAGVTAAEELEGMPVPAAFVAATRKVYGVPLVNPVTAHWSSAVVQDAPPGLAVTAYDVTGVPPSLEGADQLTLVVASPATAWTVSGADGVVGGVADEDAASNGRYGIRPLRLMSSALSMIMASITAVSCVDQ